MKKKLLHIVCSMLLSYNVCGQSFSLLKNIAPGSDASYPGQPFALGNIIYFAAENAANGREVWTSDGTEAGTKMLMDINPGSAGSNPENFTSYNGMILFTATSSTGRELWKTDGTAAGTVIVKDICPGICGTGNAMSPILYNGLIYFAAYDGVTGTELWRTDGTTAGTIFIKDLYPGAERSIPSKFTIVNTTLFFSAKDGTHGEELWKSDGTAAGTSMVKDINPGIPNADIAGLAGFNGILYFSANSTGTGRELWRSDGTGAGTYLVKDIYPGTSNGDPQWLVNFKGALYFTANPGANGRVIWKTDGTAAGTVIINDMSGAPTERDFWELTKIGNFLYCNGYVQSLATGHELWKSDGTTAGTVLVKDIYTGVDESSPANLLNVGGVLYFSAANSANGRELWKSDGTAAGTVLVNDFQPGPNDSYPSAITFTNTKLFVASESSTYGTEMWVSNFNLTLPLTLVTFNGQLLGNKTMLDWRTTDEQNVLQITLERSTNGTHFAPIAHFAANNTPGEHKYKYTDMLSSMLGESKIYYRLNIIDKDGSNKYSNTLAFNYENNIQRTRLFPNPATAGNQVQLESRDSFTQWRIITITGQLVKAGNNARSNSGIISTNALVPGIYYLQMGNGGNFNKGVKLVIEKNN